ncbi:ImmA/IrrE family metallo-endopeptidase [Gluconacetobacter azotocaptans]|uniref:XRE family transcriptional regulator n=1 Tax=Gluconacetobacter azotocaptans TaxID=142834 RepID=UPI00195D0973|nr:XRE family transcriptional regulator [Gluconacetobacter azotocaptans]MBM9401030.1 ImmA/IrrE family metallo-endopeptidase [Gluconacetobacter azotocaptans]
MAQAVHINPGMMTWARETAGLSLEEAAEKLALKNSAKQTAADKLRSIEHGERPLTDSLLQKAVTAYRRPLVSFYLPAPPQRGERGEDFRTVSGTRGSARENALLDTLVRDVKARQQMLREVLEDEDESLPLPIVGSATMKQGTQAVVSAIRAALAITPGEQKAARDSVALFTLLRAAAEKIGIYILLLGDLGSHHSDIGEDVFRGFALADDVAPFVVINDNDAAPARAFTLMHELAHIWIGASGISGPLGWTSENAIERFCNKVAGEFLLPNEADAQLPDLDEADAETVIAATARIAETWNVSQAVVTYRLVSMRKISSEVAAAVFLIFAARWRDQKKRPSKPDGGGPSYYMIRRHRLGNSLLNVVRRALQGEILTHTRAAKILGVRPTSVDLLLQERSHAA